MEGLSSLSALKLLMLGGNRINKIQGIAQLDNLEVLSLCTPLSTQKTTLSAK